MKNKDVIESWQRGQSARSSSMHTNGVELFSYDLCIGIIEDGETVIVDYTGSYRKSQTTSKHVNLAARITGAEKVKPTS